MFTENTVSSKVVADIASQTGAKVVNGLYGDLLGVPGPGAETYEGMMRQNTRIIVDPLRHVSHSSAEGLRVRAHRRTAL